MKLHRSDSLSERQMEQICGRPWTSDPALSESVEGICRDVKERGDQALRDCSRRFDAVPVQDFAVSDDEIDNARRSVSEELKACITRAARNIRAFHAAQQKQEAVVETEPGIRCWREYRPLDTVGLYVPAGTAPLPSTVLMLGVPAVIAGCRRIVLCSPPRESGAVDPAVLVAASILGIREIYKTGGAQAIAAMAYGTQTIPKVDKIFGPGNKYVTEAKRLVSADPAGAAIDLLAGPSELLIIADKTADPAILAADLLSQAEHDPHSQVVLVTPDESLAVKTLQQVSAQAKNLDRASTSGRALEHSFALIVNTLEDALDFSNRYAPEHLIINTADPAMLVPRVQHAGSVFLGPYAPVTAGDYASGTNHTLPTGGTARWSSGVTLESFQKTLTFQLLERSGLRGLSSTLVMLAQAEGLEAHARAVLAREKPELAP